jgi:hypothetical protein
MSPTPRPEEPEAAPRAPSDIENVPWEPGADEEVDAERIDEVSDGEPV